VCVLCGAARLEPPAQTLFCQQRVMKNINGRRHETVWPTAPFSCSGGVAPYFHFYFGCAGREKDRRQRGCCHAAAAAIKTFPLARNIKLLSHSGSELRLLHDAAYTIALHCSLYDAVFLFFSLNGHNEVTAEDIVAMCVLLELIE
jgi:hypothetical protein